VFGKKMMGSSLFIPAFPAKPSVCGRLIYAAVLLLLHQGISGMMNAEMIEGDGSLAPNGKLTLSIDTLDACMSLFGANDYNAALIEQETGAAVVLRGTDICLYGSEPALALGEKVIQNLVAMVRRGETVDRMSIRYTVYLAREGHLEQMDEARADIVAITHRGKQIKCKTLGQREYIRAIKDHDLTFAVGPAGTGKTYLAMALAVTALRNREVERIVLTRPAVEAGERLGFLPGDLIQKVDPYLRPLYDALYDLMGIDGYQKLLERGCVEVAPLAYMRGRTLSDSFIILDEAQNSTPEQMKMFLTRMGFRSKIVVTGDVTQTDLPSGKRSGLTEALEVLKDVQDIGKVYLTDKDVVRHELVQMIVNAYEAYVLRKKGLMTDET
jgi:phosphate starvation-inducible PhoH-like protein